MRLLSCLLLLGLAEPALADSKAEAKQLFERAETAFRLGRFEEALGHYAGAYERLPRPEFLFNMAQCHRNMGNYERAIFFLESYLGVEKTPPDKTAVEALITELTKRLEQQRSQEASATPRITTATVTIPVPIYVTTEPAPLYERGWFWGVLIGAAAAVGGAVAIYFVASNDGTPEGQYRFDYTR